jgi:hypothetical protein
VNHNKIELIVDPARCSHLIFAQRLFQLLGSNWQIKVISSSNWCPVESRLPGSFLESPLTLLLTPVVSSYHLQSLAIPAYVLILVEYANGYAYELGDFAGLDPLARGSCSASFMVLNSDDGRLSQCSSIAQFSIPVLSRWFNNYCRCVYAFADYIAWWLCLCEDHGKLLKISSCNQSFPVLPAPHLDIKLICLAFFFCVLRRFRRLPVYVSPNQSSHWQVAIFNLDGHRESVSLKHILPSDGDDWFADPYLIEDGPDVWMFCERWCSESSRGVISLFSLHDSGLKSHGIIIDESFHVSFPRVFCHNGAWFATVESGEAREVRLYRAEVFPYEWRLERVLLSDCHWIDPILLPLPQGGWLLLVNTHSCPSLPSETAAELHIYYGHSLLDSDFSLHPLSPFLVDCTCGRNAGLFFLNSSVFRVGQSMGADNAYGESVVTNRIDAFGPLTYCEIPASFPWLQSLMKQLRATHMHTVSVQNSWIAIDYRRLPS